MNWFDADDRSPAVFPPEKHIAHRFPEEKDRVLPERAVVFFLGKGLPILKETYDTELLAERLPGFALHTPVLRVRGNDSVCFVHGGYGAPCAASTAETLIAMGVQELFLVGLCGAFGAEVQVGDLLIPGRILSEEGTSRHYREDFLFTEVPSQESWEDLDAHFERYGIPVRRLNTVTTDAVYRQTFQKEAYWREQGCAAVDMEASALVTVCRYYGKAATVFLMASDKHPLAEEAGEWKWGSPDFGELQRRLIASCAGYVLHKQKGMG